MMDTRTLNEIAERFGVNESIKLTGDPKELRWYGLSLGQTMRTIASVEGVPIKAGMRYEIIHGKGGGFICKFTSDLPKVIRGERLGSPDEISDAKALCYRHYKKHIQIFQKYSKKALSRNWK